MVNDFNQKTTLRTRRMPFRPSADSDADHSANVLPVGTHMGEFEILDLIGEGGFGIVYLAYDHSLERQVALKEYMPSGLAKRTTKLAVTVRSQHNLDTFTAGLKSFINEARMLAQFDSQSLVKVHRFWEGNGTAYMVMPFYEGITLKQALKQRRVTPTESWIRILLADLFDAIEIIHEGHCLHRDIAPDNILLLKDGRPLLLDFGAARRVIGDLTQCLTAILKPGYAPIEQYADIAGLRQGPWTDIYALAAVVYYLIAGKAPPPAVARMVHDEIVPAREVGKGRYSSGFLGVLDKALAVKPEQRYRSIAELRNALDIMDTSPRTLPLSEAGWATTVMRTSSEHTSRPEPRHDTMPDIKTRIAPPVTSRREPPKPQRTIRHTAQPEAPRRRTEWVVLGILLSAGVASGVYLGVNRTLTNLSMPWMASETRTTASASKAPMESSGSSDAPEQETESPALSAPVPSPPQVAKTTPAPEQPPPQTFDTPAQQPPSRAQTPPPAPGPSREDEQWRLASNSDKAAAYEKYLREYPRGRYAEIARLRLEAKQPQSTASSEETRWTEATQINTVPGYEAYLKKYPKGRYAALAKDRIAGIRHPQQPEPAVAPPREPPPPPVAEKAPAPEPAPAAPKLQEPVEKQASIKPAEPPANVPPKKPAEDAAPPAPAAESAPSGKKPIVLSDQTMYGNFTPDPKTGIVSGTGKIVWANGNQFEGTLVKGVKEGKGKFMWANGQRYNGDWAHDMPNGHGTIVFADGGRYEGEVKDGVPHGHGKTRFKSGDVYDGAWVRGKSQGQGRYTWANGSYWEGEFKDDKRTDNGTMVFADGTRSVPANATAGGTQRAEGKESSGN